MGTTTGMDLELLERLGGSTTDVHRAIMRATGRVVVVKRAPWGHADARDGLDREIGVLSRIDHHNLVRLLAVAEDDHGRLAVLQHAPGGSLASIVRHAALDPAAVAELGAGVARALAALHREGVVHRDVHPGNVLLDAELRPVLADLDHALDPLGTPLPRDGEAVGHPDHVDLDSPPPPTPEADLAGLASTLWTAVVGSPPDPRRQLPAHPLLPTPLLAVLRRLRGGDLEAGTAATELDAVALDLASEALDAGSPTTAPTTSTRGRPSLAAVPVARGTTRWDPPRPAGPRGDPSRARGRSRHGRTRVALLAVAVLLVAGAVGWTMRARSLPVAVAPAPCDRDAHPPPGAVQADLDGDGCSEPLVLRDGVLATATGRWSLGEDGDRLLVGDWDGDGRWSPGLHRPATGAVYLFDGQPGASPLASRPVHLLPEGARPVVVTDGDHHIVIADR